MLSQFVRIVDFSRRFGIVRGYNPSDEDIIGLLGTRDKFFGGK